MPIGTQDFEYVLDNEFFKNIEGEDVQKGKVKVKLTVKRTAASFELDFDLEGVIQIPCDRCLDDMDHEVKTQETLYVKFGFGATNLFRSSGCSMLSSAGEGNPACTPLSIRGTSNGAVRSGLNHSNLMFSFIVEANVYRFYILNKPEYNEKSRPEIAGRLFV